MKKEEKMMLLEEAQTIINRYGKQSGIEEVSLVESLGRVLGEDIVSDIEMPPFNKSAMDGYAVNSRDRSDKYEIIETIPAGKFPEMGIKHGQCSKIMTGAPLPEGADRVIKVEVTEEKQGYMYLTGEDKVFNVCIRGEDIKAGDKILEKGKIMRSQEIGAAASLGLNKVNVYKKVKAGLITTGSEIREPGEDLGPGQIYNSNGYSLSAQLINSGAEVADNKIIRDKRSLLKDSFEKMIDSMDLTIISGGVSMGEFDFVPEILEELGVTIHFNKVGIQPGKPTLFGTKGDKIIFGLPGNPVSTFVIFEVLVKPVLMRMGGSNYSPMILKGKMEKGFKRRKTERDLYLPVHYDNGVVRLIEYHGSAHFIALSKSNGLLKIKRGVSEIPQDELVDVRQI
ncbi:MAG: molybdopterin molybdotransferase MoeA [Candidatus Aminicenantes bacterium]|nr:molybdopterin molybdotransferase MoeA [Candidatus Aminicenantes bacterium]MCK5004484.1 molybdopterin molybdotransferase MoeA [Candidatus Aminicenantes bacterium]